MTSRQIRTAAVDIALLGIGQFIAVAAIQEFRDNDIPTWSTTTAVVAAVAFVVLWIFSALRDY